MKLIVWFIIPAVIIWLIYLSYKYLNKKSNTNDYNSGWEDDYDDWI